MNVLASNLEKKVAIVTGGASGIGLATVHRLIEFGARVAAVDVKGLGNLPQNEKILPVQCDVSDQAQVEAAVQQTLEKWGRLDILVNNAGIADNLASAPDAILDLWTRCMAINVTGALFFIKACTPYLKEKWDGEDEGGAIVNVSSAAVERGGMSGAAYTASKHALLGLSKNTACHVGNSKTGRKITCNTVLPGATISAIQGSSGYEVDSAGLTACTPVHALMPAFMAPDDIARSIVFLATDPCINGASLVVDRGWTA